MSSQETSRSDRRFPILHDYFDKSAGSYSLSLGCPTDHLFRETSRRFFVAAPRKSHMLRLFGTSDCRLKAFEGHPRECNFSNDALKFIPPKNLTPKDLLISIVKVMYNSKFELIL